MKIGTIDKSGWLVKTGKQVVPFRMYQGFGIDKSALEFVKGVRIFYRGKEYSADVQTIKAKGIPYHKAGFEPQLVIRMADMQVEEKQVRLF